MITPQTNATLETIAQSLLRSERLIVCGHVRPDGDCLGSTLGLSWALRAIGKDVTPLLASGDEVDEGMRFLPLWEDMVPAKALLEEMGGAKPEEPMDCTFVCVDVPNEDRLGKSACEIRSRCSRTITIDHHANPDRMSDLSYTDPDATSTTMLVWELCKRLGFDPVTDDVSELATCVYTGLSTDSGSFMHQNVGPRTFELAGELVMAGADPGEIARMLYQQRSIASLRMDAKAIDNAILGTSDDGLRYAIGYVTAEEVEAAGADYADLDECVNVLRSIGDVDVVCMLKEGDGIVRGSLRSKDGTDVNEMAGILGGGGHKAAAGFSYSGTMEQAIAAVEGILSGVSDSSEAASDVVSMNA